MIIGLDVGGTHTDVVLIGTEGLIRSAKVPTDVSDLFATVLSGLKRVIGDTPVSEISRMVLSTTLTTNAVVQGKIEPAGMIVVAGPGIDPEHFRVGDHYYPVSGTMDHRGREKERLDPAEISTVADRMAAAGIRFVGVVGKFSVRNPAHEKRVAELIGERFERVFCGHELSGDLSFPRRIATTYLNAAVYPIHHRFYSAVKSSLENMGLTMPIRLLKADGGNLSLDTSLDCPVLTINSGPAASVMGSLAFADDTDQALIMDIGGTTTDMAVMVGNAPLLDPFGIDMGAYKTLIRSLNTYSVPIGGDSVVTVTDGRIQIGPDRRGPAMAFGGPVPTPTDALAVLGLLRIGDRQAATTGMATVAEALGGSVEEAADRVFTETCNRILAHARDMIDRINGRPVYTVHEMLEDYRIEPTRIHLLGGPAAHFARRLEQLSEFRVGVIPRWEVANAIGAALARTTTEVTLFADTQQGFVLSPEEHFQKSIDSGFRMADAEVMVFSLLREKAIRHGANPEYLEMEIIEKQQFNMVRGFSTAGRNIRIKAQVKPGLIQGYDPEAGGLT